MNTAGDPTPASTPVPGHRNRAAIRSLQLLAAVAFAILLAACGPDDSGSDALDSDTPVETDEGASESDEATEAAPEADEDEAAPEDDDEDGAEDSDSDSETTDSADDAASDEASNTPTVTVVDAGAEPRTELRLEFSGEMTEQMVMEQQQSLDQSLDGEAIPGAGEVTTEITSELVLTPLDGERYETVASIIDVAVLEAASAGVQAQVEAGLAPLLDLRTTVVADDQGRQLSSEITGLEGLDSAAAEQLEQTAGSDQIAVPLPEEPVGAGAVWETTQLIPVAGLELEQSLRYELLSIEGTVIELSVSGTQAVPAGTTMLSLGQTAEVIRWEIDITGEIVQDLAMLVPTSMVRVEGVQEFEIQGSILEQSLLTITSVSPG